MVRLIVGNEDCRYIDICDCLLNDLTSNSLYRNLKDLARLLDVASDFLISLNHRLNLELVTFRGALFEILEHWRGKEASEATLEKLVQTLRKLELNNIAEQLSERFMPPTQSSSPQIENQNLFNPLIQSPSLQNENQNIITPSIQSPSPEIEKQNFGSTSIQSSSIPNENENLRFTEKVGEIRYDKSKTLGEGINTFVYKGKFHELEVAVKRITYGSEEVLKKQIKEVELLRRCSRHRHPNIITFYGFEKDKNFTYIAVELCQGTLEHWLNGKIDTIPKSAISSVSLLHQATNGLLHLCKMKVVHRDLKPENILLKTASHGVVVKIADFGISRELPQNRSKVTVQTDKGTSGWNAPEILKATDPTFVSRMSTATDIFSLGCIFYYVLTDRKHPFGNDEVHRDSNIKIYKKQIDRDHFPGLLVENLNLIERMIAEEPSERPTIHQILSHPMFSSN